MPWEATLIGKDNDEYYPEATTTLPAQLELITEWLEKKYIANFRPKKIIIEKRTITTRILKREG